jgi:hypothetical protein
MNFGKYKETTIDFNKYLVTRFNPYLFDQFKHPYKTCGTAAISLLTGISPVIIEKQLPRGQIDWTDHSMTKNLMDKKFIVKKITKCDLTGDPFVVRYPLQPNHVILISSLLCKMEGSWMILHNNLEYHNFEIKPLQPLEYVNHPIMSAHVVYHPRWK